MGSNLVQFLISPTTKWLLCALSLVLPRHGGSNANSPTLIILTRSWRDPVGEQQPHMDWHELVHPPLGWYYSLTLTHRLLLLPCFICLPVSYGHRPRLSVYPTCLIDRQLHLSLWCPQRLPKACQAMTREREKNPFTIDKLILDFVRNSISTNTFFLKFNFAFIRLHPQNVFVAAGR